MSYLIRGKQKKINANSSYQRNVIFVRNSYMFLFFSAITNLLFIQQFSNYTQYSLGLITYLFFCTKIEFKTNSNIKKRKEK